MNLKDCYEKRLLRKGRPDNKKTEKALEMAEERIQRARKLMQQGFNPEALVSAYTSMFHASRAILYRDGVYEKSHVCVIEYLKEQYVKKRLLDASHIHWLNTYRIERHEVMYGLTVFEVGDEEITTALTQAEDYLKTAKKLMKKLT